jgi:hypothetical protein
VFAALSRRAKPAAVSSSKTASVIIEDHEREQIVLPVGKWREVRCDLKQGSGIRLLVSSKLDCEHNRRG